MKSYCYSLLAHIFLTLRHWFNVLSIRCNYIQNVCRMRHIVNANIPPEHKIHMLNKFGESNRTI